MIILFGKFLKPELTMKTMRSISIVRMTSKNMTPNVAIVTMKTAGTMA